MKGMLIGILCLVFLVSSMASQAQEFDSGSGAWTRSIKTHSCTAFYQNWYSTYNAIMQWQRHNNWSHWHVMPPATHMWSYLPEGAYSSGWVSHESHKLTVEIYQPGVGVLSRRSC